MHAEIEAKLLFLGEQCMRKLGGEKTENFIKNVRKFGIKRGVMT